MLRSGTCSLMVASAQAGGNRSSAWIYSDKDYYHFVICFLFTSGIDSITRIPIEFLHLSVNLTVIEVH